MFRFIKLGLVGPCFVIILFVTGLIFGPNLLLTETRLIKVNPNNNTTTITNDLAHHHVIYSAKIMRLLAKFLGVEQSIRSGYFLVKPYQSTYGLLRQLVVGQHPTTQLTIVPGMTTEDLNTAISNTPYLEGQRITREQIGLLYADTYHIDYGDSADKVISLASQKMHQTLNIVWLGRDKTIPIRKPYDLIKVASMIEKEAYLKEDFPLVASVVYNRLKRVMHLGIDATMAYGLGVKVVRAQDLRLNHPYNTYLHYGLPPTPICFPSRAALDAAAHPAHTDYLYYLAKDQKNYYAKDLAGHRALIKQYLRMSD